MRGGGIGEFCEGLREPLGLDGLEEVVEGIDIESPKSEGVVSGGKDDVRVGRREPSAACLACLPRRPWLRRVPPVGRKIRQQGRRSLNTLAVLGCCSDLDNLRGLPLNDHASTPASTFCKVIVSI